LEQGQHGGGRVVVGVLVGAFGRRESRRIGLLHEFQAGLQGKCSWGEGSDGESGSEADVFKTGADRSGGENKICARNGEAGGGVWSKEARVTHGGKELRMRSV
jgi:hypothetical protein